MSADTRDRCRNYLAIALLVLCLEPAHGIECYQCLGTNSQNPFQCNEYLSSDIDIQPQSCDAVYNAQYCVKHIGRFEGLTLNCYQCVTEDEWDCMDGELVASFYQPQNCDHVFEAQYCIKTTGRYGGGIGAKRFCSSVNMGNYCNYVSQPGDKLTYRTCVYTCTGDGCNPGSTVLPSKVSSVLTGLIIGYRIVFQR